MFYNSTNNFEYTLTDHASTTLSTGLGSITAIVNEQGNIVEEQSFDAWGRLRNPSDWSYDNAQPISLLFRGYTSHEMLPEFGLINMNGRMYDPVLGRMLSPDNYVQSPFMPQNYNRYSYAWNNPLKYTDPDGEVVWVPIVIGAAFGAYTGYKIGEAQGAEGWGMFGYIAGGAVIGGVSGYLGYAVSASGGIMANTLGIVASSYTSSVGFSALSRGMIQPSVSYGFGSYNFGTNEFHSLFNWGDLSTLEKIGYTFGASANVQDLFAWNQGVDITHKARREIGGHSELGGEFLVGYDAAGNPIFEDILVSVGPAEQSGYDYSGKLGWEKGYAVRSLQGNSAKGRNASFIESGDPVFSHTLHNVRGKTLLKYTKNLNDNLSMSGKHHLKYGIYHGCVNQTARALTRVGVFNVNTLLPVTSPVFLHFELTIRQIGIYSSPHLINY